MPMNTAPVFDGFTELIKRPLEHSDPRSFALIQNLLQYSSDSHNDPFGFLMGMLSTVAVSECEARHHWKKILEHKRRLELKLCRALHIKTAIIDYYDQLGVAIDGASGDAAGMKSLSVKQHDRHASFTAGRTSAYNYRHAYQMPGPEMAFRGHGSEGDRPPDKTNVRPYYHERLKEEILRAQRYKHALSAMMFAVELSDSKDSLAARKTREKVFAIINKAVRNVDILARHSDDFFLLILPNTNKREAQELAVRLQKSVMERTHRIPEITNGFSITIALGQCCPKSDSSIEFIKRLENLAVSRKQKNPNTVCLLE